MGGSGVPRAWKFCALSHIFCLMHLFHLTLLNLNSFIINRQLSTKSHCHQPNVNRSPQFGVWKEEKLNSVEQFANPGNTASGGNPKCVPLRQSGEACLYRESGCPNPRLGHFCVNEKSKCLLFNWSK